eukprot:jgi/Bigna1/66305/fgenesh1_pg.1_\
MAKVPYFSFDDTLSVEDRGSSSPANGRNNMTTAISTDSTQSIEVASHHNHLSEYPLSSYQDAVSAGVQARSIIFVGSVSDPPKRKGLASQLASATCSWQAATLILWILAFAGFGTLYSSYSSNWRTHIPPTIKEPVGRSAVPTRPRMHHLGNSNPSSMTTTKSDRHEQKVLGEDCEPLPLWTFYSSVAMLGLLALSLLLMCCENANIGGEIISIWLIGGSHCLVLLGLCAGFVWVCVVGWVWLLSTPVTCGPALWERTVLLLPFLSILFCVMFLVRVAYMLDSSDGGGGGGDTIVRDGSAAQWDYAEAATAISHPPNRSDRYNEGGCCSSIIASFLDCFFLSHYFANNRREGERLPLYGLSVEDEVAKTTADHDEKHVPASSLISMTPRAKSSTSKLSMQQIADVVKRRWDQCRYLDRIRSGKKKNAEKNDARHEGVSITSSSWISSRREHCDDDGDNDGSSLPFEREGHHYFKNYGEANEEEDEERGNEEEIKGGNREEKVDKEEDVELGIRFKEFSEHFAGFFDEIGTKMGHRLFNSLADVNGRLSLSKLQNGIYRWGQGSMRDKLTLLFDMWDLNRNGKLDREEIHDMMNVLTKSSGTTFLSAALHLGNADTTRDEIRERMDAILERFEASLDSNSDDAIKLDDWLRFAEGDEDIHRFLERFTVRSF